MTSWLNASILTLPLPFIKPLARTALTRSNRFLPPFSGNGMPLDPLVQAFLDQLNAQPAPPMWQLTAEQAREMFAALMALAGPKDVPIGKTENISIPGPECEIPARIYSPVAAGSDA